jgi:PAS domain S-box-containing protein
MQKALQRTRSRLAGRGGRTGRSLHARIGLTLAALVLLLSLGLALALAEYSRRQFTALGAENMRSLSQQMARELASGMDLFTREVQLQASSPLLRDPATPVAALRESMTAMLVFNPSFAFASVADMRTGTVLAASNGVYEGGDLSGRPVFENAKQRLFLGDVHEAARLAELLPRPGNGEPLRFLDIGVPILDQQGRVFRILAVHIGWQWADRVKNDLLGPLERDRQVQIAVIDTAGKVVLSPDALHPIGTDLRAFADMGEAAPKVWSDGKEYLTSVALTGASGAFPGFGWHVVVRQPMSVVLAATDRLRILSLLGALLLGSIGAGAAWLVAGRIVKPVADLARAASGLQLGEGIPSAPGDSVMLPEVSDVRRAFTRVASEGEARFHAMADAVPQMLWQARSDGTIAYANSRYREFLGLALATGSSRSDLVRTVHASQRDAFTDAWQRAAGAGVDFEFEARMRQAGGPWRWHLHRATPQRDADGVVQRWFGSITDIDDLKRAQIALETADQRKSEFLAMLAHELRNPLAPIVTSMHLLAREPAPEQARLLRAMVSRQVAHLVRLVEDLLDVSRITHNKIKVALEPVAINDICALALETTGDLLEKRRHRIEVDLPDPSPLVCADRVRLTQVLGNLLTNAAKYTPEGGVVALQVRRDNAQVAISVADNGRGIEPALLPQVFDLFIQADAHGSRSDGGLGVGLTIARQLVELQGGNIRAESAGVGQGSVFTVTLPVLAGALPAGSGALATASASAGPA